jgi:Fe-S-cluster containining protein
MAGGDDFVYLVVFMAVYYECQRCMAGCRWPGEVKLTGEDITGTAIYLGLDERDFIESFTQLRWFRMGLTLAEKPNGECVFLDGIDCRVQRVKPKQCREFPNLWRFPGFQKQCHAIPRVVSDEEYRRLTSGTSAG